MSVISMGWVGGRGMGYTPDTKMNSMVQMLRGMPGYSALYGHMTGIMYAAGVLPGTELEQSLIDAGHFIVGAEASKILQKETGLTKEPATREELFKLFAASDALIQIDAMVQTPDYSANLKKMITTQVQQAGTRGNRPYALPSQQTKLNLTLPTPLPGIHYVNGACVADSTGRPTKCDGSELPGYVPAGTAKYGLDIEGGATTGDGSTAKKIAAEAGRSEAAVLPILETGTGTGKIWGMDSKTFLLVAGAGLLLMMNSD